MILYNVTNCRKCFFSPLYNFACSTLIKGSKLCMFSCGVVCNSPVCTCACNCSGLFIIVWVCVCMNAHFCARLQDFMLVYEWAFACVHICVRVHLCVYSSVLASSACPHGFLRVPGFKWLWGAWFPPRCWPNTSILDVWHSLRYYLSICLDTWHRRWRWRARLTFLFFKSFIHGNWSVKSVNSSSWRKATEWRSPRGQRCDLFAVWTSNTD